jgi:hypothetical protein
MWKGLDFLPPHGCTAVLTYPIGAEGISLNQVISDNELCANELPHRTLFRCGLAVAQPSDPQLKTDRLALTSRGATTLSAFQHLRRGG